VKSVGVTQVRLNWFRVKLLCLARSSIMSDDDVVPIEDEAPSYSPTEGYADEPPPPPGPPPPPVTSYGAPYKAAEPAGVGTSYSALAEKARTQRGRTDVNAAETRTTAEGATFAEASRADAELGAPALKEAAHGAMEAQRARGEALYAANKESIDRAQQQAQIARAQAQEMSARAMDHGMHMASGGGDIARQQFEDRWNRVLEAERELTIEAAQLQRFEQRLLMMMRNDEPNFPKCCCIDPIVFHDILADITAERQSFVRGAYTNWYLTIVLLIYNVSLALAFLFVENAGGQTAHESMEAHLGIAAVFLVFGVPLSFMLWYWPLYKACGTGASGQHIMAYIGLFIAFLFDVIVAVGPIGFGGCGMLFAFEIKNTKKNGEKAYIAPLVNAILFIIQACYFVYLFWKMKCVYGPEDKASIAKANAEMMQKQAVNALRGR